jgi:hypothetical protein
MALKTAKSVEVAHDVMNSEVGSAVVSNVKEANKFYS